MTLFYESISLISNTTSSYKSHWSSVISESLIGLPKIISTFLRIFFALSGSIYTNLFQRSLASSLNSSNERLFSIIFPVCQHHSTIKLFSLVNGITNSINKFLITKFNLGARYLNLEPANSVGVSLYKASDDFRHLCIHYRYNR